MGSKKQGIKNPYVAKALTRAILRSVGNVPSRERRRAFRRQRLIEERAKAQAVKRGNNYDVD